MDPNDPDRLAAVAIAAQELECDRCPINLVLATSADGGASWRELPPATGSGSGDGVVAFAPDGTLHAAGIFGGVVLQRVPPGADRPGPLVYPGRSGQADKPWLTVDPRDGALYVAYTDSTYAATQRPTTGIVLKRSADGGATWATAVVAPGAEEAELQAWRGAFPLGAVPLAGRGRQVAVAWCDRPMRWLEPPIERAYPWPLMVALSEDGGQTFGAPRQVGEMWGFFGAAGDERGYYLAYAAGTAGAWRLAVTRSDDGGATWATAKAADLAPPGLNDLAPGVGLAPDGTLDIVTHGVADQGGFDLAAFQAAYRTGDWRDPRTYHAYYLGSADGGRTFSAPARLAEQPVVGARFLRTQARSRPGEYLGMASTDRYAYPIWIATEETGGPYAAMARVER